MKVASFYPQAGRRRRGTGMGASGGCPDQFDIFISYSHLDGRKIDQFVNVMEAFGYTVWRDNDGIGLGESIRRKVKEAQDAALIHCFWVTENWKASRFCQDELDESYSRPGHWVNVVDGTDPPGMFAGRKYVKHDGDMPETCCAFHKELRKSSPARASEHLALIRTQANVESAAHALHRMITLYSSEHALRALSEALQWQTHSETNLDYCFRYFRMAFEGHVDGALWAAGKRTLEGVLNGSNDIAIDKAAYSVGQLYLNAVDPVIREWAKKAIRRYAKSSGPVGDRMTYTKRRVQV